MKIYHSKKQNTIPEKQNSESFIFYENLLCMMYIYIH